MFKVRKFIKNHLEWIVLSSGLILMAFMNPDNPGRSLCIVDALNIYCPGEGLGRSISFIFRGMWPEALSANPAGFLAVPVLTGRIVYVIKDRISNPKVN